MTRKQKRLAVIGGGVGFLLAAVLLVMFAFSQSVKVSRSKAGASVMVEPSGFGR